MPGASDTCQALGGVETSMVKHVIMSPIPLSRPPVDDQIKQAVLAAIDSRQYILGPQCRQLEAEPLYGQPADLTSVQNLAARLGLWVLEDCAQAQGAEWNGRRVGTFGRAAVFSFYPSKNLPALGDGGAILTGDDTLEARCRRLRDHGRVDKDVHAEIGFNLRFNELQAAALRVLLRRLDAMNDRPRYLALRYARGLAGLPLVLPGVRPPAGHVYHLFVVQTPRRDELAAFLKARGIQTGIHYPVPTHRQAAVERFAPPPLPRTERLVEEILSLPISADHADGEIDRVVTAVRAFFGA